MLLFRIAQEALHNAALHAAATEARVTLSSNGNSAKMTVVDNGQGFQLPKRVGDLANRGKMGLLGMHERAQLLSGTLHITSELGKGTQVEVDLPLNCVNLAPAPPEPSQ